MEALAWIPKGFSLLDSISPATPTADQTAASANATGCQADILHRLAYNQAELKPRAFSPQQ